MYQIGELIGGRYDVREVHLGGQGVVYICYDNETLNVVALKTPRRHSMMETRSVERFVRESHTWLNIRRHRNIVQAYSVRLVDGSPYLSLEYIPGAYGLGASLRGWILNRCVTLRFSASVILQVCDALTFAQQELPGFVHRDLKPENILITHHKIAKVTDLGLSLFADNTLVAETMPLQGRQERFHASLTHTGCAIGTPPYMSPEQCMCANIDARADIYSLGSIFYELLTGEWLMDSPYPQDWLTWHVHGQPAPPSLVNEECAPFDHIVLRCLAKAPADRYQSFTELSDDLGATTDMLFGRGFYAAQRSTSTAIAGQQADNMSRARSFALLGRNEEALQELDVVLGCPDQRYEALLLAGKLLVENGNLESAERAFRGALLIRPMSARASINLATLEQRLGRHADGKTILQQLVSRGGIGAGVRASGWNNIGIASEELGEYEEALASFEAALRYNPYLSEAWQNKAGLLERLGRLKESKLCWRMAFYYSGSYGRRATVAMALALKNWTLEDIDDEFFELALHAIAREPATKIQEERFRKYHGELARVCVRAVATICILGQKVVYFLRSADGLRGTRETIKRIVAVIDQTVELAQSPAAAAELATFLNAVAAICFLAAESGQQALCHDIALQFVRAFVPGFNKEAMLECVARLDADVDLDADWHNLTSKFIEAAAGRTGRAVEA